MDVPVSDQGLDKLPVHSAPGVVHDLLDLKLITRHSFLLWLWQMHCQDHLSDCTHLKPIKQLLLFRQNSQFSNSFDLLEIC